MGSNKNRHRDKGLSEWGSKARKEENRNKRHSLNEAAIDDQLNPKPTNGNKRRKRDTKRWCRGKVGQDHKYELISVKTYFHRTFHLWTCNRCGKRNYGFNNPNEKI